MREAENIRSISALDIHWMGFIFYPRSPRCVEEGALAGQLAACLCRAPRPLTVGVFVNATSEQMMERQLTYGLDYLQLHGEESPDTCYALKKRGIRVIKSFAISETADFEQTEAYEERADYFLFDTRCSGYGGSGRSFDWSLLSAYQGETPFLLSGGITPDSTASLLHLYHPLLVGIDLNSGFEIAPGLKDVSKIKTFIEKINKK